jgi:hypothetical protein
MGSGLGGGAGFVDTKQPERMQISGIGFLDVAASVIRKYSIRNHHLANPLQIRRIRFGRCSMSA